MLRRLFSILLFAATLLPLIAPLLSSGAMAQSTVPACCRRGGRHQCGMLGDASMQMAGANQEAAVRQSSFRTPLEQCPYRQRSLGAVHVQTFTPAVSASGSARMLHELSLMAQAECLWRISFDRSRQKRGPPSLIS